MNIKAIIYPAEEGSYWAEVPALAGCIAEGDSMEEVIANLKHAILLLERLLLTQTLRYRKRKVSHYTVLGA